MKTGRNDPCPCGSGKKYKKCCLADRITQENIDREEYDAEWEEWFKKDCEEGDKRMREYDAEVRLRCYFNELKESAGIFMFKPNPPVPFTEAGRKKKDWL